MKHQIDDLDKKILSIVTTNARTPFLEIARECKVSGAAIHQRIQKLLYLGVIKGSQYIIDTQEVGYNTCAYVGMTVKDSVEHENILEAVKNIPEIVECHYTTGRYGMLLKVYAHDNHHLLDIIVNKLSTIKGVGTVETLFMSLNEAFNRQLTCFDSNLKIKK